MMWQDMHKESSYVMEQPVMLSMALTTRSVRQPHMISNHTEKMFLRHFVMLCSMKQDAGPFSIYLKAVLSG